MNDNDRLYDELLHFAQNGVNNFEEIDFDDKVRISALWLEEQDEIVSSPIIGSVLGKVTLKKDLNKSEIDSVKDFLVSKAALDLHDKLKDIYEHLKFCCNSDYDCSDPYFDEVAPLAF